MCWFRRPFCCKLEFEAERSIERFVRRINSLFCSQLGGKLLNWKFLLVEERIEFDLSLIFYLVSIDRKQCLFLYFATGEVHLLSFEELLVFKLKGLFQNLSFEWFAKFLIFLPWLRFIFDILLIIGTVCPPWIHLGFYFLTPQRGLGYFFNVRCHLFNRRKHILRRAKICNDCSILKALLNVNYIYRLFGFLKIIPFFLNFIIFKII